MLEKGDNDNKINEFLGNILRHQFKNAQLDLTVDSGDIAISTNVPDQHFEDGSCKHKFYFYDLNADGKIKKSSNMVAGLNFFEDSGPSMLLESKIDAHIAMRGNLRGSRHQRILGKCIQLARKTLGLQINSDGEVAIGIKLQASEFSLKQISWKSYAFSFRFGLEINGRVIDWDVTSIKASNCNIEIFGIKVLSFCSWLENRIAEEAKKYIMSVVPIQAPKLVQKLESKLQTKIGDEICVIFHLPWL